jgi:hypothetical protein
MSCYFDQINLAARCLWNVDGINREHHQRSLGRVRGMGSIKQINPARM